MPKIEKEFREAIKSFSQKDLQKIVLELAGKKQETYDYLNVKYVAQKDASHSLFEDTKASMSLELDVEFGRGPIQKRLKRAIANVVKKINYFVKVAKNKEQEAELLLCLLELVFEKHESDLGTVFTTFDFTLCRTTNRLLNLVTKKLHEDHLIEYQDQLNRFLSILHKKCSHIDFVYTMPDKVSRD
jgi:hypothetical protein